MPLFFSSGFTAATKLFLNELLLELLYAFGCPHYNWNYQLHTSVQMADILDSYRATISSVHTNCGMPITGMLQETFIFKDVVPGMYVSVRGYVDLC